MPEGVTAGITLLANRYEIGDVIGRGGMATVHVGTDTRLGRRVAVKLLKPSLANDPAFRIRCQRPPLLLAPRLLFSDTMPFASYL